MTGEPGRFRGQGHPSRSSNSDDGVVVPFPGGNLVGPVVRISRSPSQTGNLVDPMMTVLQSPSQSRNLDSNFAETSIATSQ